MIAQRYAANVQQLGVIGRNGSGVCLGVRIDSERQINAGLATGIVTVSYDRAEWLQTARQTVEPILSYASRDDIASTPRNLDVTLGTLSALAGIALIPVVFETGRVFGGDSIMIYTGKYRVVNGMIEADIHVDTYASQPGMASIVGLQTFDLKVTGTPARDQVTLSGHVVQNPNLKMTITAVRRAELP